MQSTSAIWKKTKQKLKGNFHFTLRGVRRGGCLFLWSLFSCGVGNNVDALKRINEIKPLLINGDIIVRNGKDEVSRAARNFNRVDKAYSHCGIIQRENDTVFVYHALGGACNPSGHLMRQPLNDFCNPREADKFAIYRYGLNKEQNDNLSEIVRLYYKQKLQFDVFFNFYTNDKMYCSEFVFKCLNRALHGQLNRLLHANESVLYVAIDDLYRNDRAKLIAKRSF